MVAGEATVGRVSDNIHDAEGFPMTARSRDIRVQESEDRTIIYFEVGELTHESTRRLVPDLSGIDLRGIDVGLELRPIRFVRPFGLIYLFWYIRWLLDEQEARRVDVVLDRTNRDLCNYLKRMNLPEVFGDDPVAIYPIQKLDLQESELAASLVELNAFRVDDDNEVERRTADTLHVITSQRPDLGTEAERIHITISEMLSNVHVHSETRNAALAVQTYRDAVVLAFGDAGQGVPAALEGHVEMMDSDAEYLRRALEPGVTSRPGGGGYGLTQLTEMVEEEGGSLVLRSGTGQVVVGRTENSEDTCTPLPGTLAEISLPT